MRCIASGSWRCPINATNDGRSSFSIGKRSRHCSRFRILPLGWGVVIEPFFWLRIQTGLRVSELIGLNCQDVVLGTGAHVRCLGKGRKQRCTPLRPETAKVLDAWLRERHGLPENPVFPSIRGGRLSRDAVERLIAKYTRRAGRTCPRSNGRRSPRMCSSRRGHGSSSPWRGSLRDRALAGARIRGDNTDVPPCGHAFEGEGALAHCSPSASNQHDTALMTTCWPSWKPSDYADSGTRPAPLQSMPSAKSIGIIRESACRE